MKKQDKSIPPCMNCIRFPICISEYHNRIDRGFTPTFIFTYYLALYKDNGCRELRLYLHNENTIIPPTKSEYECKLNHVKDYFNNWREYET